MRSRISALLAVFLAIVLLCTVVPLALVTATADTQQVYVDRAGDIDRFVSLIPEELTPVDERTLSDELTFYQQVYSIPVIFVDVAGRVRISSRQSLPLQTPGVSSAIRTALAGRQPDAPRRILPWQRGPLIVARPVLANDDVTGAIVSASPTRALRARILRFWLVLALGAVLIAALAYILANRLADWVLKPIFVLSEATEKLAYDTSSTQAIDTSGPPELRTLATAFNDMAVRLAVSRQRQSAFVADASHQLRNPLSALLFRLDGLMCRLSSDPATHQYADDAAQAVDDGRYLAETVESMLALTKHGRVPAPARMIDVAEVVGRSIELWSPLARARHIRVRSAGEHSAQAWFDESALAGALDVAIDNAIKYSPDDATVTVCVGVAGLQTSVTVSDEGEGVHPDDLRRMTERLWRGPSHPEVAGAGLGMGIAAVLMERYGGEVTVANQQPHGLMVALRMPSAQILVVR